MASRPETFPQQTAETSPLVLGLDIGTTTITCLAWEPVSGQVVVAGTVDNQTQTTSSMGRERGHSEWDSQQMLEMAYRCLADVVAQLGPRSRDVVGLGLTGQQHGVVVVDEELVPLTPFIGWRDQRGNEPLAEGGLSTVDEMLTRLGDDASERLGCRPATGYLGTTLYWMQRTSCLPPQGKACFIVDLFAAVLTGSAVQTDPTNAGGSGLLNLANRQWDAQALELLEIERRWLPDICEAPTPAGGLNDRSAALTNLPRGLPVMVGIGDNQAAFLGSVADRSESILVNVGTGGQVAMYSDEVLTVPLLETRPFPGTGNLLVHAGLCGGRSYAALELFFREVGTQILGVDKVTPCYSTMLDAAEQVADGSGGVVCSPFFTGTRSDPHLRASWSGLSPENLTPGHLTRALLEGMARAFAGSGRLIFETTGRNATRVVGAGNGLRENRLLASLVADAFDLPMVVARYREEAGLGAALVAATGVGICEDLQTASQAVKFN